MFISGSCIFVINFKQSYAAEAAPHSDNNITTEYIIQFNAFLKAEFDFFNKKSAIKTDKNANNSVKTTLKIKTGNGVFTV